MFKIDSPLMVFLGRVADVMLLNLLFIVFSIPVFTIGASFAAAYYVGFKMVKNEDAYIIKSFWKAFRENFRQATILWLIMLAVAGFIIFDFRITAYTDISFAKWLQAAMLAVAFLLLLGAVFIFPLQARFVNPIKNTIKNAFLIAVAHLPSAILLIAIYALPVLMTYQVPQAFPIILMAGFGAIIYGKSFLLVRIFKSYEGAPVEENNDDEGIFNKSELIEKDNSGT